jgi:hypothetical protein
MILLRTMRSVNRLVKLAAASLALLLFATPLAAFANCSAKAAMAVQCGGEHCPMMHARQQSDTQISEIPSGDGSCCQMSSLPPGTAKPAVTNETRISLQPATAQIPTSALAPVAAQAPGPPGAVLAVGPPPQALLCTFLI